MVEPFRGSCVVALNIQPERALLTDTNKHIIILYQNIQSGRITPKLVRTFLQSEGDKLEKKGEEYYYEVRRRFNITHSSLDFIFLNRACFNGVMRFNKKGEFNVPFCKKPYRFAPAYITKIVNQVMKFAAVIHKKKWEFKVADFRETLSYVAHDDVVYIDPPYAGRHVDYYNSWSDSDERDLAERLCSITGDFILSTWHSNAYRKNPAIAEWRSKGFYIQTIEHFYHVGSTEDLRNPMIEALIANYEMALLKGTVQYQNRLDL